jgi:ESS family glutamate:Na+ symporter
MAAATFGLVSGGLLGGPVATRLVRRWRLTPATPSPASHPSKRAADAAGQYQSLDQEIDTEPSGEAPTAYTLLKIIAIILVAMWAGASLGRWIQGTSGVTLPAYIGAMIVAAMLRNADDGVASWKRGQGRRGGLLGIEQRVVDDLGTIALSLFLAMALMSLKLWELLDLAIPMLVILLAQVTMMGLYATFLTFPLMGRDYDAGVMAGGHCGFGLGATPNAVANMEAIVERFGMAPRAFLVLPLVGAFFIDFTNAIIITTFMNVVD